MSEPMGMLNPKIQNITDARGGFGSLTPEDIAHALGGLAEGPYQMGLVYYCGANTRFLVAALYDRVVGSVQKIRGPYINTLCHMAIAEVVGDNICPDCAGRSFIFTQAGDPKAMRSPDGLLVKPCQYCHETGRIRMTNQEKADIIGEAIGKPLTDKEYLDRYSWDADRVFMIAQGWLSTVNGWIHQRLERD